MRVLLCRVACLLWLAAACSKLPESEAAKKIGAQPKQTIDKVNTDLGKAAAQEAAGSDAAEKK